MTDKVTVNPALIEALEHYAYNSFDMLNPHMFVYTQPNGHQESWTVENTCATALKIVSNEDVSYLKLLRLMKGLREHRMEYLYEHIMGEPLEPK